jgi:hypothetical protein
VELLETSPGQGYSPAKATVVMVEAGSTPTSSPQVPPEIDAAVITWMLQHGWTVGPARWEMVTVAGFHVWQEDLVEGRAHALWVAESMVRHLSAEQLITVLEDEDMAQEIRISLRVLIHERGAGYRVSVVPRRSGGWQRPQEDVGG